MSPVLPSLRTFIAATSGPVASVAATSAHSIIRHTHGLRWLRAFGRRRPSVSLHVAGVHDDALISTTPREAARTAAAKVLAVGEFVGSYERCGSRSLTPEAIATSTKRPRPMPHIRIRRLKPPSKQAPDKRTGSVTLAALTTGC